MCFVYIYILVLTSKVVVVINSA